MLVFESLSNRYDAIRGRRAPACAIGFKSMNSTSDSTPEEIADLRNRRFSYAALAGGPLRNGQVISSHSLLLEVDLRLAYCSGAWLSVIVLASAAVEAQSRQVTTNNYTASARALFADDADLQWLRSLRNELVHAGEPGSRSQLWKVGGGDIRANQAALEDEATRAVEVMFRTIYGRKRPPRRQL